MVVPLRLHTQADYDRVRDALLDLQSDVVAHAARTVLVRKTATESVTSSTALQDDDELKFTVAAGQTWLFQIHMIYDAGTTGDIKFAFNTPASSTLHWSAGLRWTTGGTLTSGAPKTTADDPDTSGGFGAGASVALLLTGTVVTTNAGTVVLRWAQNTSDATATRVFSGSSLMAQRVA